MSGTAASNRSVRLVSSNTPFHEAWSATPSASDFVVDADELPPEQGAPLNCLDPGPRFATHAPSKAIEHVDQILAKVLERYRSHRFHRRSPWNALHVERSSSQICSAANFFIPQDPPFCARA